MVLGAASVIYGLVIVAGLFRMGDRRIQDHVDAFFGAAGGALVVLGLLGIASGIPHVGPLAQPVFRLSAGAFVAIGLAWGSVATLHRAFRLFTGSVEEDVDSGEHEWSLLSSIPKLVSLAVGFWVGAAIVGLVSGVLCVFLLLQLGNLWGGHYGWLDALFEAADEVDDVLAIVGLVIAVVALVLKIAGRLRGR
jgi:hypothetical protein